MRHVVGAGDDALHRPALHTLAADDRVERGHELLPRNHADTERVVWSGERVGRPLDELRKVVQKCGLDVHLRGALRRQGRLRGHQQERGQHAREHDPRQRRDAHGRDAAGQGDHWGA